MSLSSATENISFIALTPELGDSASVESLLATAANGKENSNWEWKVKYERLFEAHRKLQKMNNSLVSVS